MNSIINIVKLFLDSGIFSGNGLSEGSQISINSGIFAPLVDGLIPSEYLPYARQHSLQSTYDHTSTATSGTVLKADANGLPVDSVIKEDSGKIGIGCSPLNKLHVNLGTDLNVHFKTASGEAEIKAVNNANDTTIPLRMTASEINFSGNVGVGTYAPSEKLEVSGNIKASGSLYSKNTILNAASGSATTDIAYGDATTHNIDIPLLGNGGTLICKFEAYTSPTNRRMTYRWEHKYHMGWGGAGAAKITLPLNGLVDATSGSFLNISNGSVYSSTNIRFGFTGTGLTSGETAYIKVTYGFAYESWELNPS